MIAAKVARSVLVLDDENHRPRAYGTIIVVGGGCYGTYYVRQLGRASIAGALNWRRLIVVDRNPDCALASSPEMEGGHFASSAPSIVCSDWRDFFDDYLSGWASAGDSSPSDAIVPSPLMPHIMYEWLRDRASARWPDRSVTAQPLPAVPEIPWQRAAPDGTHYVSFAEWMCPVNCVEPALCPHTRGERHWTMPRAVSEYVEKVREGGDAIGGPVVFHCTHRAYGVGMFDTADVVRADALVSQLCERGPASVLVGTVSHCHGVLNLLSVT